MKIGFYIPIVSFGGAERVLLTLLKSLVNRPEISAVLVTDTNMSSQIGSVPSGITLVSRPFGSASFLKKTLLLRKVLVDERFDVMVSFLTHSNLHLAVAGLSMNKKRRGVLIGTEHSVLSAVFGRMKSPKNLLVKFGAKLFYGRMDCIIAVSWTVLEDLVQNFAVKSRKLQMIHNPVDVESIKGQSLLPCASLDAVKSKGKEYFVCVGRLSPEKNQDFLIKCMPEVRNQLPNLNLVLVGGGPQRDYLMQLTKDLDVDESVIFTGAMENPYPLIKGSMAVAIPSITESFSLSFFEGSALGRPVVANTLPIWREVDPEGVILEFELSTGSFVAALRRALTIAVEPSRVLEGIQPQQVLGRYLELAGNLILPRNATW